MVAGVVTSVAVCGVLTRSRQRCLSFIYPLYEGEALEERPPAHVQR